MANNEHLAQLKLGVKSWNKWRSENPHIIPDLSKADLHEASLRNVNLSKADLNKANLRDAYLRKADLNGANVRGADLREAYLTGANLCDADLSGAKLRRAYLRKADLSGAKLPGAILRKVNLSEAILNNAILSKADLSGASLVEARLTNTDLTGCRIYGVSAWGLNLEGTKQQNLIITDNDEPEITVDNIEVAQFVYLLLHNPKIRDVIDTIGQKAVLILGRFTPERKKVLDAIREELRQHNYVPILFDFDKPASQDLTATVSTLAHMVRFIIADLTDPSSIPYELATVVPTTPVPVQPILLSGQKEFAMFVDLERRYQWVLAPHCYKDRDQLIAELNEWVIRPAERKALELRGEAKEVP